MKLNIVPARTGLVWVKVGIRTFIKQPLALAGLFFLYMTVVIAVAKVPYIGVIIGGLLVPAATLGLMAATEEAARGRFPMPSVLLSAFRAGRQRARAMLLLGAIYTAGSLFATQLAVLIMGDQSPAEGELDFTAPLALLLHAPLILMFWHAPALVHWHGITPVKSLFFSMIACLKNFGAFAIYALGWLAVTLAVGMLFALLGSLIGGPDMARAMTMPVALLMAAMFSTSIYFTFRDCFVATPEPEPESESPPTPEEPS